MQTNEINVEDFRVLTDLFERLAKVSAAEIQNAAALLKPPAFEKSVGQARELTQRLHALQRILSTEAKVFRAQSEAPIYNETEQAEFLQRANVAYELSDLANAIGRAQARNDTGYWDRNDIGMRADWTIVVASRQPF